MQILPQTETSQRTFIWLKNYFELVGDQMSNVTEVHVDFITYHGMHQEYSELFLLQQSNCYDRFIKFIHELFPIVKIREFKSVQSKCEACFVLSDGRITHYCRFIQTSSFRFHERTSCVLYEKISGNYV